MFYTLLDIAAINAFTIYKKNKPQNHTPKKNERKCFLHDLALALVRPHCERRASDIGLHTDIVTGLREILPDFGVIQSAVQIAQGSSQNKSQSKGRCHFSYTGAASKRA